MNETQLVALRSAINTLNRLLPSGASPAHPTNEPVARFVRQHFVPDPNFGVSSASVAAFYMELAASGLFPALPRQVVLRRIAAAVFAVWGIRRTHNLEVEGRHRRGFKGLNFRSP
jgi:hypothetical protein